MFTLAAHPFLSAFSQSDFFGKLIFLALGALSLLSWYVIIFKIRKTKEIKSLSSQFQVDLMRSTKSPLSSEADQIARRQSLPHPFLQLFLVLKQKTVQLLERNQALSGNQAVELSQSDIDFVESHICVTIASQSKELRKHLHILSTTYSLAPFLGLLGTVWGILTTFSQMQAVSGSGSQAVLGGLSMALGTTVLGLVIAIPALIAYNYLKQNMQDFETDMENFSSKLLAAVELQYRGI